MHPTITLESLWGKTVVYRSQEVLVVVLQNPRLLFTENAQLLQELLSYFKRMIYLKRR